MLIFNRILYHLLIIPISRLPFPLLYGISNFLYVVFYYVLGYRKRIILGNIQRSFPKLSSKEHTRICKEFYKHFCDLILESLKTFTISEEEVLKRVTCKNPEVIDKYYDRNQSVIIAGGHYNNWEVFAVAISKLIKHKAMGIYKPLTNVYFDEKMRTTRSKYGLHMVSTKKVKQVFEAEKENLTAIIFAIDQSPSNPKSAYWMKFLNQDTGVLFGTEKYAKEYNYPVLYCRINKEKRGFYSVEFFDVIDQPANSTYGQITEKVTHLLENDIRHIPAYWLWSHRRWKHKPPVN